MKSPEVVQRVLANGDTHTINGHDVGVFLFEKKEPRAEGEAGSSEDCHSIDEDIASTAAPTTQDDLDAIWVPFMQAPLNEIDSDFVTISL